ncbi:phage virulence factor, partial [Salmonella enterica subsp. enterica serovar Javiana]|nr:phage virulence factor [Salmonella enterica]EDR9517906.1 phage virulence factor [Salmonella enterica subsp. enterica serovar Javiana]EDV7554765.1 phage virulence factor [Salmonella enterica subsp. enterica serovar Saintpaul]EEA8756513.1 phage virulence factor [Salmonella enterica subsp. enterica]EEB9887296.1 phage virulence factor [Salmonella enterica subsp. enterica serovar Newport]
QKWCELWRADMPLPPDFFKMCRGY